MQDLNRSLQDEIGSLRHTISNLDKDKDKLLSGLDEKTIECVTLKQELASKHHRLDELNAQFSQLESSYDSATSHLNSQKKVVAHHFLYPRSVVELIGIGFKNRN